MLFPKHNSLFAETKDAIRNTPTGVGKTQRLRKVKQFNKKHPHGRGEDAGFFAVDGMLTETPPRAWGRRTISQCMKQAPGNTPTGVGKTKIRIIKNNPNEKHPHGRGEDAAWF